MTTDKADVTTRLRQARANMLGTDDEPHYWDCHEAAGEIERLREAIRRYAEQDATLSVCEGAVTVTMDATLFTEERDSLEWCIANITPLADYAHIHAARLRGLLDRLSPIATRDNDRPEAIDTRLAALEALSAADQELELKYGLTGNPMIKAQEHTQQPQTTPGGGSVRNGCASGRETGH